MKKRLLKAMPHVPILELRPELREQNEATDDPDDPEDAVDNTELNTTQSTDEGNTAETEANTTFHDLEAKPTGAKFGLVQRIKRFISKRKANVGNIAAGRTGLVMTEDDTMRYGDDENSESDNEGDPHDGIPLVRRNTST